ncbi:MAG: protein kinase [Planctomycetes bacterium]|nr:protein kinase [Planctomycetota bacterium]
MPLSVVVVEDEPAVQDLIRDVLESRGYLVRVFGSAGAAWTHLRAHRPSLLLVDVGLPDESGLDLLRRLRCLHGGNSYPALIVSGHKSEQDILLGYEAGGDEYLTKPFSSGELLAKCAVLIARSPSARETQVRLTDAEAPLFERYEVNGILGRGAFGVVYHALDLRNAKREVALKVCGQEVAHDAEHRFRFLRESYALASLIHPHIVSVTDFGLLDDELYLAMDYIEGPTLASHVRKHGALSTLDALALFRALASALQALAKASLVHRDVKPANIILRRGAPADPVLVDFGLAKRSHDRSVTAKTTFLGTIGYMAPEIFLGQEANARSDLFSLGLVLRYALTGEELYPQLQGVALMLRMARGGIPIPTCEAPWIEEILRSLLASDPAKRPDSSQAVLSLLAEAGVGSL